MASGSVSEDLLADWSADLEAVLYAPEVEEAIQEVIFWCMHRSTRLRSMVHASLH